MLFSNPEVSSYINQHYEPTWKSLRPVPKVCIDFGNGTVVNRTLHGNIATYLCTADGAIIDILPGAYQPKEYQSALKEVERVAAVLPTDAGQKEQYLANYHRNAESTMMKHVPTNRAGLLADDTLYNETLRRAKVHEKLALTPQSSPEQVTRWLYRDVLHADLDDPYLGLKPVLFATYPFAEDKN